MELILFLPLVATVTKGFFMVDLIQVLFAWIKHWKRGVSFSNIFLAIIKIYFLCQMR